MSDAANLTALRDRIAPGLAERYERAVPPRDQDHSHPPPPTHPPATRAALFVAAQGHTGLWTASVAGAEAHRLIDGAAVPLVWSDTDVIYFVRTEPGDSGRTIVEAVNTVTGAAGPSLPRPVSCEAVSLSGDGNRAVCAVREAVSDVWVVDNLDLGR